MPIINFTTRNQCYILLNIRPTIINFSYQNKATEHYSEENEPLEIFVLHQTSDAAPEFKPIEVLVDRHGTHAVLWQTVVHFNNVPVGCPLGRLVITGNDLCST